MLNLYDSSPRPRKTQKLRAWIDAIVALGLFGLGVLALAFPRILPSALGLGGSRQADTVPTTRAWAYANPEPVARAWASGLEPSLVVACRSTLSQLRGPGFMKAALAPKLDARSRQPGADEAQDAISSLGSDDQFLGACLRWAYDAIAPCERHAKALGGREAEACLLPPVQRVLAVEPWKRCAAAARLPSVAAACGAIAQVMQRRTDRPAAGL